MRTTVQVRGGDKASLLRYLKDWMQQMAVAESGHVHRTGPFPQRETVEILTSKLTIRDLEDQHDTVRLLVDKAVISLKKQGIDAPLWKDFEHALEEEARSFLSQPTAPYRLLFLLAVSGESLKGRTSLDVLGGRFTQVDWLEESHHSSNGTAF